MPAAPDTPTNGALVAQVRDHLTQAIAAGRPTPGRRALANQLGVTEYAIRQALTDLRAPTPAPAPETGRPPVETQEPAGAHPDPPGETRHPPGHTARAPDMIPGRPARWPLLLLAAPAFVAIWGGWVGLGQLVGFGVIQPLPGIWDGLHINSAVTLPIGLETYAAYALHVALTGQAPSGRARAFAAWSAGAALTLGAAGQVAYHLMTAAGLTAAPWGITAAVAVLPVLVLGMGAGLYHLTAHPPEVDA